MKFVLFVEGHTEKTGLPSFLKRWLDPRLPKPVGIQPVRFDGWQEFVKKLPVKARMHLEGPAKDKIAAAIGLLDLYGPTFYPSHLSSAAERCDWAVQHLQGQVNHPKFRMFFAVHELEAWILSQPQFLPPEVSRSLPAKVENPESVNFQEPPAKLLDRLYTEKLGRGYKRKVYGAELFRRADPGLAYDKCPHLKEMLDEMLRLTVDAH